MKIISLGLGVQSTALYYMSSMNYLPKVDYAIFADLGREKKKTIQYLKYLQGWQLKNNGIPIIVIRKRNLYKDLLTHTCTQKKRFASIPAFTKNEDGSFGMLLRQCTVEYKIQQVDKAIREILNLSSLRGQEIEVWKGISLDEIDRLSVPDTFWKVHIYPFCNYVVSKKDTYKLEYGLLKTRNDLIQWYIKHDLPIPPKSSCVFCPYQSDASWYDMKKNEPSDFKAAVRIDREIRNSSLKGVNNPIFLHSSCKPLEEIVFDEGVPDLWHGECSGNCHT